MSMYHVYTCTYTCKARGAGFNLLSRQPHSGIDNTCSNPFTKRHSAPAWLVAMEINILSMASMSDSSVCSCEFRHLINRTQLAILKSNL